MGDNNNNNLKSNLHEKNTIAVKPPVVYVSPICQEVNKFYCEVLVSLHEHFPKGVDLLILDFVKFEELLNPDFEDLTYECFGTFAAGVQWKPRPYNHYQFFRDTLNLSKKRHGICRIFSSSNHEIMISESLFENGLLVGKDVEYYRDDGTISCERWRNQQGQLHGPCTYFASDGKTIVAQTFYANDKLVH